MPDLLVGRAGSCVAAARAEDAGPSGGFLDVSLVCYLHPRSSAQDRCAICRRTICPACVVWRPSSTLCRSCAEARARDRRVVALAVASAALAAAVGLGLLVGGRLL